MKKTLILLVMTLTATAFSGCVYNIGPQDECETKEEQKLQMNVNEQEQTEDLMQVTKGESHADIIACIMINGELYYDTGRNSTVQFRCGNMDGNIDSTVGANKLPEKDNQSNFGIGYGYQIGARKGTIEVNLGGEWRIFATDKTLLEMQVEYLKSSHNDDTMAVSLYTVRKTGGEKYGNYMEISYGDAHSLMEYFDGDSWEQVEADGTAFDCSLNLAGEIYNYNTFDGYAQKVELSKLSMYSHEQTENAAKIHVFTEKEKSEIDGILEKYISQPDIG